MEDPDDGYAEDLEEEEKAKEANAALVEAKIAAAVAERKNAAVLEEAKPKGEFIEPPKPPSTAKKELVAEIGKILQQYNNQESNIPIDHEYWKLVKAYRNA